MNIVINLPNAAINAALKSAPDTIYRIIIETALEQERAVMTANGLELIASLCMLYGRGCTPFLVQQRPAGHNKAPEAVSLQGLDYWTWDDSMAVAVAIAGGRAVAVAIAGGRAVAVAIAGGRAVAVAIAGDVLWP